VKIRCPHCGRAVTAPDQARDGRGRCASCGGIIDVAEAERVGLNPGDRLGGCRIEGLIGQGGLATVYRATQLSLDRPVALKVFAPRLARSSRFVERFAREVAALAKLSHPNIVRLFLTGIEDGTRYVATEYVDGESLREKLRREGRVALAEAVALVSQVIDGLETAHARGVLHGDIKPENILLTTDGAAKLSDFGLARLARLAAAADPDPGRPAEAEGPADPAPYAAPEQANDAASVGPRADIYALGVTLYEMITGQLPVGHFAPASRLVGRVPPALDRVIGQALARSPEERFGDVAELRDALTRAAARPAIPSVPRRAVRRQARRGSPSLLVAAIVLAALLAGAAFVLWRVRPADAPHVPPPSATAPASAKPLAAEREAPPPAHAAHTAPQPKAVATKHTPEPKPKPEPEPQPQPERPDRAPGRLLVFTGRPLTIEAEHPDDRIEPMQVARDQAASGDAFLWEPRKPGQNQWGDRKGRAVYYVRSHRAQRVRLWARVRAPNNSSNSFFLAVQRGRTTQGDLKEWHLGFHTRWAWVPFQARATARRGSRRATDLWLQRGLNSIIIAVRERGAGLDQIRIIAR